MQPAAVNALIVQAIEQRRRLHCTYNGRPRRVEPQCYGMGFKGTELLRVHQLAGGTQKEPLFDVAKIVDLTLLDETFTRPGPNYKRGDSAMKTIFCEL